MSSITIRKLENMMQDAFDDPLGIDEIQAVFTAIAIGPELIKPSDWIEFLFGDEDDLPKFESKAEAEDFFRLIMDFYNETLQSILQGDFEPVFLMIEDADSQPKQQIFPEPWCRAFIRGMSLHGKSWEATETDDDFFQIMMPIAFFINQELFKKTLKIRGEKKMQELREFMTDGIAEAVMDIRDYFLEYQDAGLNSAGKGRILSFEERNSKKTRRNDPCPCGSGKKYKFCCGGSPGKKAMRAYQFKVALMHDKKTYRNIAILGNQTLDDLHESIFDAFDRVDPHLYSFFLTRKKLSNKRKIYQAPEYTLTAAMEDFDMASSGDKFDAENKTIEALQLKEKEAIYYLFDFGDEWWHELTLIAIQEADPSGEYPTIVKKAGESPEQYPDYHGEM